ncbi:MAG: hypothetical protein AB7V32_09950, partial [Candidatus Berkiella sp.]
VSFAQELQTFKSQGYKIVAMVETEKASVSQAATEFHKEHSKLINNRAESVEKRLLQLHSLFDEMHLIEFVDNESELVDLNKPEGSATPRALEKIQDENQTISDTIRNCSMGIVAGYFSSSQKKLPPSTPLLNLQQYGSYQSLMGLTDRHLGVKLYPEKEKAITTPAQRLLNIGENEPAFIQNLFGKINYNEQDAEQYLATHYFIPGYIQTFSASSTFILSQIEKHAQSPKGIEKRFDFVIPGSAIDEKLIRSVIEPALVEHGIKPNEIQFIDANELKNELREPKADNAKHKVRILSPFITSKEDYEAFYFLTHDGTGCSGDNTISISFSGQSLPYFQFKPNGFVISRFYTEHLIPLLENIIKTTAAPILAEGLISLKAYFEHLTTFSTYNNGLFDPRYFAEPDCKYRAVDSNDEWDNIVKEQYLGSVQKIIDWCKETGRLSNAKNIMAGWLHFQKVLFEHHNMRSRLRDLVQLKLNQSQPLATLLNTRRAKQLVQRKIITDNQFNAGELSKLIATDDIVGALCTSELTPAQVINMSDIDLVKFKDKQALAIARDAEFSHQKPLRAHL